MSNFQFFLVKNVSASDKALAEDCVATTDGGDDYDLLTYKKTDNFTFEGTEDYVHELDHKEARTAKLSPIFKDYPSLPTTEAEDFTYESLNLQMDSCRRVFSYLCANAMINEGVWTATDRQGFHAQLYGLASALTMGDIIQMRYELRLFVDNALTDYAAPVAPLTVAMVNDAVTKLDVLAEKIAR